jgi:hypothetical protein
MREGTQDPRWDVIVRLLVHPRKVEIIELLLSTGGQLSATDLLKLILERDGTATLQQVNFHAVSLAAKGVIADTGQDSGAKNTQRTLYTLVPEVLG